MTTTTPVTIDPATMLKAKANLALFLLALGVPLVILSSYGLLRQAFNSQAGAAPSYAEVPPATDDATPGLDERAPGLYQRSQPVAPVPTITYEVVPVPTSTGPTLGVLPPAHGEYRDGHNATIPGCGTMDDGMMHCWGGFAPATWAMTPEERAVYSQYINDDTGEIINLDDNQGNTTGRFITGTSQHTNTSLQNTSTTTHPDGPWAAPGYSTGSGMRGGN